MIAKRSSIAVSLAVAVGLACVVGGNGYAQVPPEQPGDAYGQPAPAASSDTQHHCNTGAAAVVGGLLGAFLGKGKGHLVGAVVGAGLGALACTAYNYHVRKLRDAQQVDAAYQQQHGALPTSNTVASYTSALQPGSTVQAGSNVSLQSTIAVVSGTNDVPPQVSEQLTLLSPDGKTLSTATKQASEITAGGEYQTNFNFDLPKGIKDGNYTVRTAVLMNGQPVRTNETPMLVVG